MKKTIEINYCGVILDIEGDFMIGEEPVMYYPDGSGHPGYDSQFIVNKVLVGETDLFSTYCDDQIDEMAEIALHLIEND